ncbi:hypothetical protein [Actinomadura fibrosa]|uniref:Radical SAM protein n=1 Tax=Actinomadura fibrosa TaxID=111802 RepID=A0ABW2XRY3_9ACTN|nr:hypothetical protein [Actinomadura fibrosa]
MSVGSLAGVRQRWVACDGPVVPLAGRGPRRWRDVVTNRGRVVAVTWSDDADPVDLGSFRDAVEGVERCAVPGVRVEHALWTDGSRLDDAWCRCLGERDVLVGLSADGVVSDDRRGRAAARRRMADAVRLLRRHGVACVIVCAVHAGNAGRPLDAYRYFRDELGVGHVQFLPVVERVGEGPRVGRAGVSERTVRPEQWAAFLVAVFDEWVRRDVGRQFVQVFEEALGAWVAAGRRPRAVRAGAERLPLYCRCCPVLFACGGGRPGDRFVESPDGESGLDYLCAGYREFFDHVGQPMRVMAALVRGGRDAAEIMKVIARYERERPAPAG